MNGFQRTSIEGRSVSGGRRSRGAVLVAFRNVYCFGTDFVAAFAARLLAWVPDVQGMGTSSPHFSQHGSGGGRRGGAGGPGRDTAAMMATLAAATGGRRASLGDFPAENLPDEKSSRDFLGVFADLQRGIRTRTFFGRVDITATGLRSPKKTPSATPGDPRRDRDWRTPARTGDGTGSSPPTRSRPSEP